MISFPNMHPKRSRKIKFYGLLFDHHISKWRSAALKESMLTITSPRLCVMIYISTLHFQARYKFIINSILWTKHKNQLPIELNYWTQKEHETYVDGYLSLALDGTENLLWIKLNCDGNTDINKQYKKKLQIRFHQKKSL